MQLPTTPGLYIATINHFQHICEWTGHCWYYPNNPIDIYTKYGDVVSNWIQLPTINDRDTSDYPLDKSLCVVKLVGSKLQDHGLAIATYDAPNYTFKFTPPYDGWTKDYDDWQFVGWGLIPS
jgi:hypothetical protein